MANERIVPKIYDVAEDVWKSPQHYTRLNPEPIDVIHAWELNFNLGNAVKYIARAGHKGDKKEDLRKAIVYLEHEIKNS